MIGLTSCRRSFHALLFGLALLCAHVSLTQPGEAAALGSAAATASGGLGACNGESGKALYNCVAGVLDRLGDDVTSAGAGQTGRSLKSAAAGLRSAATKPQALSAIARCQSFVAKALQQVRSAAGSFVEGLGGPGLNAISGVLARAAQLIQTKG